MSRSGLYRVNPPSRRTGSFGSDIYVREDTDGDGVTDTAKKDPVRVAASLDAWAKAAVKAAPVIFENAVFSSGAGLSQDPLGAYIDQLVQAQGTSTPALPEIWTRTDKLKNAIVANLSEGERAFFRALEQKVGRRPSSGGTYTATPGPGPIGGALAVASVNASLGVVPKIALAAVGALLVVLVVKKLKKRKKQRRSAA